VYGQNRYYMTTQSIRSTSSLTYVLVKCN